MLKYPVKFYITLIVYCAGSQIIWYQEICTLLIIIEVSKHLLPYQLIVIDIYFIIN